METPKQLSLYEAPNPPKNSEEQDDTVKSRSSSEHRTFSKNYWKRKAGKQSPKSAGNPQQCIIQFPKRSLSEKISEGLDTLISETHLQRGSSEARHEQEQTPQNRIELPKEHYENLSGSKNIVGIRLTNTRNRLTDGREKIIAQITYALGKEAEEQSYTEHLLKQEKRIKTHYRTKSLQDLTIMIIKGAKQMQFEPKNPFNINESIRIWEFDKKKSKDTNQQNITITLKGTGDNVEYIYSTSIIPMQSNIKKFVRRKYDPSKEIQITSQATLITKVGYWSEGKFRIDRILTDMVSRGIKEIYGRMSIMGE